MKIKKLPDQFFIFVFGVFYCLLLFGLGDKLSFLTNQFGRIFAWTPGDIYDASLNNWFLESNFKYFLNGGNILNISEIFNASHYWPEKNTLAMSDNWILITPFYAILRIFLSPNFAFTGIIILSLTANFMACYHICRHATNKKIYRLIASFLSAFSLTVLARLGHAQLMPAFAGVLSLDCFISSLNFRKLEKKSLSDDKKRAKNEISISISYFLSGIIWLLLQIGIGFYQGTYFALATFSLFIIIFFNKFPRKNTFFRFIKINLNDVFSRNIFILKSIILTFLISTDFLIYRQYLSYSSTGTSRSWGEVSSMIPKIWSLWFNTLSTPNNVAFPSPVQNIDFNTFSGPFWEHSMFPGYAFIFLLIFGIFFGLRNTPTEKNVNIKWRVMILSKVCLLMLLLTMGYGGNNPVITPWLFFWKFIPGVSALRAVSRIGIPIVLLLSPLLAWTLGELHNRLDKKSMTITFSFLFILYLAGNVTKGISRFDSTDYAAKKNNIINKIEKVINEENCKAFYMTSPDTNDWMFDRVHPQMMAMWASVKLGIPTSSGYSGNNPDMGWNHMMTKLQLQEWLRKKGVNKNKFDDVCWINGNDVLN